jgi:ribose transport system ATP-binding protein
MAVFRQERDARAHRLRRAAESPAAPIHGDVAAIGPGDPEEHLGHLRAPGTDEAEEAEDLAPAQVEADIRDEGLDFEIRSGEVLGLTGLIGSGFERVPYLIFGGLSADAGRMMIGSEVVELARQTPWRAIELELALVPGNRLVQGAVGNLTVSENASLQVLSRFRPWALRLRQLRAQAAGILSRFDVRPDDPGAAYSTLSGGNQQKVLLAKWLRTDPKIILMHEPTQGVDIGARMQIFSIVRAAAARGASVIVASNDLEQIAGVCDRALLFTRGRISGELAGAALTKTRLAEECFGVQAA